MRFVAYNSLQIHRFMTYCFELSTTAQNNRVHKLNLMNRLLRVTEYILHAHQIPSALHTSLASKSFTYVHIFSDTFVLKAFLIVPK